LGAVYEYAMFLLICICATREVFLASTVRSAGQVQFVHFLHGHRTWLKHISNSRSEGTLGPLRLEDRHGRVCVVGLGQREYVQSVADGIRLITRLKEQIAGLFC
jgi:hypothetical protein